MGASAKDGSDDGERRKLFKHWFDQALVEDMAQTLLVSGGKRRFDVELFVAKCAGLDALEMSGRVGLIADAMKAAMGRTKTRDAMAVLVGSMAPMPEAGGQTGELGQTMGELGQTTGTTGSGYRYWPYGEFIGRYGLDDVDASFEAMVELTKRFTSEFAVRPFLAADVDGMLVRMEALVDHPSQHVRRWLSEGTRSRLPWGKKVPSLGGALERRIALLSRLRFDEKRYVQRSIANHLQDILKDDLERGLEVLRTWSREDHDGVKWLVKHAARGLLKAGHPEVMELFGFASRDVHVRSFAVSPTECRIGESVTLVVTLENRGTADADGRVDFALTSPTKTKKESRKVFRWVDRRLSPGEVVALETRHNLVHRTIRTVHPGRHRFEVLVNGTSGGEGVVEVRGAP